MHNKFNIKNVKKISAKIRKSILEMAYNARSSAAHIGGALSLADIVSVLFFYSMNYDKKNFLKPERDRFILSKGHACLAYYASLYEKKIINRKELLSFEKSQSFLFGHPVKNKKKGIEFSTGSLGMGLSLGIGLSIALKYKKNSSQVFVIMGDGECNEGSVWESALIAPNLQIDNLTVIIDKNNFQQTGSTDFILKNDNLKSKWESFNWDVYQIDGHNHYQIYNTIKKKKKKKSKLILCNTIKGKGVSFFEGNNDWHHNILSSQLYKNALKEIKQND